MSVRSLNKVTLIGNLTRDPELRYTPSGTAVCSFGLATNRSWTTQTGEIKEEAEFHRIIAWNKLAELCGQLLQKGRKVYVEGRIASHSWTGQDGVQKTTTEIVIWDMILLDSRRLLKEKTDQLISQPPAPTISKKKEMGESSMPAAGEEVTTDDSIDDQTSDDKKKTKKLKSSGKSKLEDEKEEKKAESDKENAEDASGQDAESASGSEDITPDDIPF